MRELILWEPPTLKVICLRNIASACIDGLAVSDELAMDINKSILEKTGNMRRKV